MRLNLDLEIGALVIMIIVMCLQKFGGFVKIRRNLIFYHMLITQVLAIIFNSISSRTSYIETTFVVYLFAHRSACSLIIVQ